MTVMRNVSFVNKLSLQNMVGDEHLKTGWTSIKITLSYIGVLVGSETKLSYIGGIRDQIDSH